jgi:hypothetical protein
MHLYLVICLEKVNQFILIFKGIYFTDVCSKAANYCHANIDNNEGILLLCEVALGNIHKVYSAQ